MADLSDLDTPLDPALAGHLPRLLADVGGTNVRFARQRDANGPLQDIASLPCADFPGLLEATQHYLARHAGPAPRCVAVGIATPITGDEVRMTNHHWAFSTRALQASLGAERLLVLNDFTALALALPALPAERRRQVGGGEAVVGAPVAVLGPGTGLGVSGLLPAANGQLVAIGGEGGHVTLAAADAQEAAVLQVLQRRFGHASAERALSGPGLENLYLALAEAAGQPLPPRPAAEITREALAGTSRPCVQALEMFCSLLGNVAGNLALTLGARGGVFIGGGIVPRLGDWLDRSRFRERFESKGRFRAYLQAIPTFVVQAGDEAALLGAARALDAG